MYTMILKVNIWENADKTERRIYVETFRGEYTKMRGEDVAQFHGGCLYRTGNHWNPKGSKDGDLTDTEWHMSCNMSKPNTFIRYYHPRYEDILAANPSYRPFDEAKKEASALAERQAERAKRDPRLDTATEVAGYGAIGSFVKFTDTYNNIVNILIVLDTYEFAEEDEQSSSDRRQSGWYARCVEPNELEKQRSDYVKLAAKVAENKDRSYLNDLAIRQFGISAPRIQTNEPDDELFNDLFSNGELDN